MTSPRLPGSPFPAPVRRVFRVGRNHTGHPRKMGQTPDRDAPFVSTEPVAALGAGGTDAARADAPDPIRGDTAGFDVARRPNATRRTKPNDKAAPGTRYGGRLRPLRPIGGSVPAVDAKPGRGRTGPRVNGDIRRGSASSEPIWGVPESVAYVSCRVRFTPGVSIFTTTPEDVAAVWGGDVLERVEKSVGGVGRKPFGAPGRITRNQR